MKEVLRNIAAKIWPLALPILVGLARTGLAVWGGKLRERGIIDGDQATELTASALIIVAIFGSAVNKILNQKKVDKALHTPAPVE